MAINVNEPAQVTIREVDTERLLIPIVGMSPLIMHRFSAKAKAMMLANAQQKSTPKEPKDPAREYLDAFYRLSDAKTPAFPALAFKAATVSAARFYKGLTMTSLKQSIFFDGQEGDDGRALVPIIGEPEQREDVVTVGRAGTDLRYRPQFRQWSTTLDVTYVKAMIDKESVLALVNAGGMGVGVGEWRPERDGDFGRYKIDDSRTVDTVAR